MAAKINAKDRWVSPIGQSASAAAARMRRTDPVYAALEKKYEVSLAVADLVILHRTRHGMTQQELASRMGTSVAAISRLESGFHLPSLDTLRKVAAAIGGRVKIEIVDVPPIPPTGRKKRTTTRAKAQPS